MQLLGSGTILRESIAAQELLEKEWGVSASVWSCPSFNELTRDGQDAERWNMVNPTAEQRVTLTFTPPSDVGVGKYDIRVRATSRSDNQPLEAEPRTVSIQVNPKANIFGTAFIVLAIIGLVVGIVVFGIRLARR